MLPWDRLGNQFLVDPSRKIIVTNCNEAGTPWLLSVMCHLRSQAFNGTPHFEKSHMSSIEDEIATDKQLVEKIRKKLPNLFHIAELESSRAGKVGMEVGSLRERIIVAMLVYKFGEDDVEADIPITEPEIDVRVRGTSISIKTLTSRRFAGVKLVWTVDAQNALQFKENYSPTCDMIFVQISWEKSGGFYYIPVDAQKEVFSLLGRDGYIKLPLKGTNPRGVEIAPDALERLINHRGTLKIDIHWSREVVTYNPFERWVRLWEEK